MEESEKLHRIVEARMKLKARFEEKIRQTPSVSDTKPLGSGQTNRHGMPQVPVGQTVTKKWPVLDLGTQPEIKLADWRLTLNGAVDHPVTLDWNEFMGL